MNNIIEKLLYCVKMINLIKWLSNAGNTDYQKRIISRSIFVYLDAFFEFAPQVKNSLEKRDINVKATHEKIATIRTEYENYYATIRDKLAAHRQDLTILETFEIWNEIDLTTLDYFISEALDIYNLLHALKREEVPAYVDFPIITNIISPVSANVIHTPVISSDSLALTRPNTISFLPINSIQKRGSQINSIIDTLLYLFKLYPTEDLEVDLIRVVKSMIILDVINLLDNIYPFMPNDPRHKIESFLEISQLANLSGYNLLYQSHEARNQTLEEKIREVRNKICAHIDTVETLDNTLQLLDEVMINELIELFTETSNSFYSSCKLDIRTQILNINGEKLSSEVISVSNSGFIKDFEK